VKIGMIGDGAIATYVRQHLEERGLGPSVILLRPSRLAVDTTARDAGLRVGSIDDLPKGITHMIDCAGHSALAEHGPAILQRGIDLTTVSIGALADASLAQELEAAAVAGGAKLHLVSGAIGALDCLQAAKVGQISQVTYIGRKPPAGWRGSAAEQTINLDQLGDTPAIHFEGSARQAALTYPKNANVAATVALAGVGMDATQVQLIADPTVNANIHEVHASGEFGSFSFRIEGRALAQNPRSSALAAMSVVSKIEQQIKAIQI